MAIIEFPSIESANEDGLLAIGGDLEVESLLLAYGQGIFPWPISSDFPLAWFSPNPRGILFLEDLHISKSMKKTVKKLDSSEKIEIKFNENFQEVVENCASITRKGQEDTWITQEMKEAYFHLFLSGYCYSIEIIEEGNLVAGLYGVCISNYFCGESMFGKKDNYSKYCFIKLIEFLKIKNIKFFDTQVVTPVTSSLGVKEISRLSYLKILKEAIGTKMLERSKDFFTI